MYLISVYFDEKANKTFQRYINILAEKTGNTFMPDHAVPPHMTISAIEARSVEVLCPQFKKLQGEVEGGKISFVSTGQLFPYVFYTTPVFNEYLWQLSKTVYEHFGKIPETSISRYYCPGSWLPHVTLGKTLTKEQMRMAFEVMQENFVPFEAEVTEMGLAKVNPHEDVERFWLSCQNF